MKLFTFNLLKTLYYLISLSGLLLVIVIPFSWGSKDSPPIWFNITIFVLAVIVASSQSQTMSWFDNQEENLS